MSDNENPEEPLSEELANAPAALAVRCPGDTCSAEPGLPCRTSTGAVRERPHLLRWLATPGSTLTICTVCGTPIERLDDGVDTWWVHLRHPEDNHDALAVPEAIRELVTAICHTVDYVGNDTLPAKPGWSWYDALVKYAPEQAQRYVDQPVLLRRSTVHLKRALETLADNLDRRARKMVQDSSPVNPTARELYEIAQGLRALADGGDVQPVDGEGYALDREPQPGDGPQYHDEHRAWRERQERQMPDVIGSGPGYAPLEVPLQHPPAEGVRSSAIAEQVEAMRERYQMSAQTPDMVTINVMGYPISVPASLAYALGEDIIRESGRPRIRRTRGPGTVVTICGSTRFRAEMAEANHQLTLAGHIVLAPGVFAHAEDPAYEHAPLAEKQKEQLDAMHLDKIDASSWVYVVNVGGYIGESTRREIEYARLTGKEVIFHETKPVTA